jgi:3-methyladenine DNA glycosylase AlkD
MASKVETMTAAKVLKELKTLGSESYRRILRNHGAKDPLLGVKIEELKKIVKRVRKDHELALGLFDSGVYDAQYLAGLIADEEKMTRKDLERWLRLANSRPICGTAVAWVAAESRFGRELGLAWIDSRKEDEAVAGWATLSALVSIEEDSNLDIAELKKLVARVEKTIHDQPDAVRYGMNGFVICVGCYVRSLTDVATETGERMGRIEVDMGDTACKVPHAPEYIRKVVKRGTVGNKRKTARC